MTSGGGCDVVRVIDYWTLMYNDIADLRKQVNKMLGEGWQPLGGMVPCPGYGFCQTMVKYKEEDFVDYLFAKGK